MRICRNSATWLLLQVSVVCGQLPYHALKLLDSNYARTQDAFQKLCRAGYLEVVKAPGHKSFFVTVCKTPSQRAPGFPDPPSPSAPGWNAWPEEARPHPPF